jgi:hypothetical protein
MNSADPPALGRKKSIHRGPSQGGERWSIAGQCPERGTSSSPSKSRRTSAKQSPSAVAYNSHGFDETLRLLRSVLHHGLGLPLACYLHDSGSGEFLESVRTKVPELFPPLPLPPPRQSMQEPPESPPETQARQQPPVLPVRSFDMLFKGACVLWLRDAMAGVPKEVPLTAMLCEAMREALRPYGMSAEHSPGVPIAKGKEGRPDIMVRHNATGHPALMIEAYLHNESWWQKMDQSLLYLVGLKNADNHFTHPVLLTVITVDTEKKEGRNLFHSARIGTFLVTCNKPVPTDKGDFRLALLRRRETTDLDVMSAELGRVMRAASLVPHWAAALARQPNDELHRHEYLGPNCRRVGNKVACHCVGSNLSVLKAGD